MGTTEGAAAPAEAPSITKPDMSGDDTYYLEQVTLDDDSEDEFEYEEVPVESDDGDEEAEEEDLESALKTIKQQTEGAQVPTELPEQTLPKPKVARRPEVVDDFIRNFLLKMGMHGSLEVFQREWYSLQTSGKLGEEDIGVVPDIYLRNQYLDEQLKTMRAEMDKMKDIATKAKSTWDKFRKERDFHKMHHKRVVQEKNKLILDLKRLKKHFGGYEPMLKMMRHKYEVAMKEKMLMKLERDRLAAKVGGLEAQIRQLELETMRPAATAEEEPPEKKTTKKGGKESSLPSENRVNPYLSLNIEAPPVERWGLSKTFQGHTLPVSAVCLHPTKAIIATVSDDTTWKMWSLPGGELIMSGDGHKDWLSSVDFHPRGTHLATGSGDCTVKLWDFASSSCSASFTDHTQAVWGTAFHDGGDFLVSCSMDHTAKLWDLHTARCRQTFRGHVDSINAICFQPFSNNICTGSGDKTVSLWDCRSGLCIQTFYGHLNACNHVAFSLKGDTVASTDADGIVKLWDVRMVAEAASMNAGPHPANKCAFDMSGKVLSVASDDGSIKLYNVATGCSHIADMRGHDDAVQSVAWDQSNKFVISGASDASFRMWC